MIPAHSLKTILESIPPAYGVRALKPTSSNDRAAFGYMVPGNNFPRIKLVDTSLRAIVGILFAQPTHKIVKDEILDNLEYFHERSGTAIHFFLAGYGAYWQPGYAPDMKKVVSAGDTDWYYSNKLFIDLVKSLEKETKWRYSGECDLILVNINGNGDNKEFDFNSCILLSVELLVKKGIINSVRNLFEDIFRAAEDGPTIKRLGDALAQKNGVKHLQEFIATIIPQTKSCINAYNELKEFAVKKVNK